MLISKIHLPRRTVLKALGATVGLPLLDAMIPAGTTSRALARSTGTARPCVSFVYFPHGAVMDQWTPRGNGGRLDGLDLPRILAPLAPFRKQLTIVSGLENRSAIAPPAHAITPATWLSCTPPAPVLNGVVPKAGVTVDQVVAATLGQHTRFDSIQLATEVQGGDGASDRVYGAAYSRTISFRAPSSPLTMEHDAAKVFRKWVGQDEITTSPSQPATTSVLDLVRQDAADLSRRLGARDRAVLGDYLENVRAIERRVQAPTPLAFNEHVELMFDLMALAYEANLTRVGTFMMAAEVSNQSYDFAAVGESFHALSHHGNSPEKLQRLAQAQAYNTNLFAKFVSKLAKTPDGDGSLLDHSLILYGSNMSNSNLHDHSNLPVALLGGGCGKLTGGRHIRVPEHTPLANLHVALLNEAGAPTEAFGDSTGMLTAI
ncbi:MAG TPA: DUF1552 domain-containing protein [Steroidobacteraceae bacterium]